MNNIVRIVGAAVIGLAVLGFVEGIISKRKAARYRSGRDPNRLKITSQGHERPFRTEPRAGVTGLSQSNRSGFGLGVPSRLRCNHLT